MTDNKGQEKSDLNKYLIGQNYRMDALIMKSILSHRCELVPMSKEIMCALLLVLFCKSSSEVEE